MLKLGRWLLIIGGVMTVIGLVVGFGLLFTGHKEQAMTGLSLAPLGFVFGFAGLVIVVMTEPRDKADGRNEGVGTPDLDDDGPEHKE